MEGGGEVSLLSGLAKGQSGARLNKAQYENFIRLMDQEKTLLAENAAMREAIRDSDAALRKCLNYMLRLPMSGSDAECEVMDDAHHALSKLQPFLNP